MSLRITQNTQMFVIFKAIELAAKGFDISHTTFNELKSTWWNAKSKSFQTRMTDSVPEVYLDLTEDALAVFPYLYNNKVKRNRDKMWETIEDFPEGCEKITISSATIKQTMMFLVDGGVYEFNGVPRSEYDTEYLAKLAKLDEEWEKTVKVPEQMVADLSRDNTRKEFRTMCALAYSEQKNSTELLEKLQTAFDNDADFSHLPESLKRFKVVDNRMYIPIKPSWKKRMQERGYSWMVSGDEEVYFVISKNLYDFFFCSYGSSFQSCFALNSGHGGWQGAVINGLHDGCYMLYLARDHGQRVSLTAEGRKYPAPAMLMRTWLWACNDGKLHIDKLYTSSWTFYDTLLQESLLDDASTFTRDSSVLINAGAFSDLQERYRGYWYPDSIKFTNPCKFYYDNGRKEFMGYNHRPNFLQEYLQRLTSVSDKLDLSKTIVFDKGVLYNPKICPVTGLFIDEADDVSVFAKHFKKPVEGGLIVLTYIDGYIRVDDMSDSFDCPDTTNFSFRTGMHPLQRYRGINNLSDHQYMSVETSVSKVKEQLQSDLNKIKGFDMILLRVVNGSQVTWIKLRKDK